MPRCTGIRPEEEKRVSDFSLLERQMIEQRDFQPMIVGDNPGTAIVVCLARSGNTCGVRVGLLNRALQSANTGLVQTLAEENLVGVLTGNTGCILDKQLKDQTK